MKLYIDPHGGDHWFWLPQLDRYSDHARLFWLKWVAILHYGPDDATV